MYNGGIFYGTTFIAPCVLWSPQLCWGFKSVSIKINFNGGDLSSDGGLLHIKEFAASVSLTRLVNRLFKTNDHTACHQHTDPNNLMQMIYQIIAAYFEDDCADELTKDPVLTAILERQKLASQVTC